MQLRFSRANIGALADEGRWQADRQLARQGQAIEIDRFELGLRRKASEIDGQLGLRLRQRLAQRRQCGARGSNLALREQDVALRFRTGLKLLSDEVKLLLIDRNDFLGRTDLPAQGCFADAGGDDVAGQCQIGCVELVALEVGQRLLRLDTTAHSAEQIEGIAHRNRGVVDGVERSGAGARCRRRGSLSIGPQPCIN